MGISSPPEHRNHDKEAAALLLYNKVATWSMPSIYMLSENRKRERQNIRNYTLINQRLQNIYILKPVYNDPPYLLGNRFLTTGF